MLFFSSVQLATEPSTPIIPPVGLKAIVLSSTTIVLTWTDTTLGRNQRVMDNRHYTIKYTPRAQRKQKFINSTDLNVHIEDLKPDTEYEFSVKIVKGKRQSSYSLSIFNKTKEACELESLHYSNFFQLSLAVHFNPICLRERVHDHEIPRNVNSLFKKTFLMKIIYLGIY